MTTLWIISDLHLEADRSRALRDRFEPSTIYEHDVVVLAGDVYDDPCEAVRWAAERFGGAVLYVCGNHEFFGGRVDLRLDAARRVAGEETAGFVRVLEDAVAYVDDVRFVGATLWTDYRLHGIGVRDVAVAMRDAVRGSQDHHLISGFMPQEALIRHNSSRAFIEQVLAEPHHGPTVVVTHHAPSPQSVAPEFVGNSVSPAYASDLTDLIERWQPDLWIHGHTHTSFDYRIGRTRVLCNPRGFGGSNLDFRPDLVVEVGR